MPDYQKMYRTLFNKVSDVIAELQQVQRDTERLYMESAGTELLVMGTDGEFSKQQNKPCERGEQGNES